MATSNHIHLILKKLSSELLQCALQIGTHRRCDEFLNNIVGACYDICKLAIEATWTIKLCGPDMQQCAMHNAQCNNSEDNLF